MLGIIDDQGVFVREHRLGFFEGHPVFPEVQPSLR
jgi:hypothetical protein